MSYILSYLYKIIFSFFNITRFLLTIIHLNIAYIMKAIRRNQLFTPTRLLPSVTSVFFSSRISFLHVRTLHFRT